MAKLHGRNAQIMVGRADGSAEAEAFEGRTTITIDMTVDRVEVTSLGDASKTYVAGLPDGSIGFQGFYDATSWNAFAAAIDGVARKIYVYPDRTATTKYFFLTGTLDASMDMGVGDAVKVNGSIKPSTPIYKSTALT